MIILLLNEQGETTFFHKFLR